MSLLCPFVNLNAKAPTTANKGKRKKLAATGVIAFVVSKMHEMLGNWMELTENGRFTVLSTVGVLDMAVAITDSVCV